MKFVLASKNAKKLTEMRDILSALDVEVISQDEAGVDVEAEETGDTFEENALIKAQAVTLASGMPAIADDSGLTVDALGGAPGVYSARYTGSHDDSDEDRYNFLLKNMLGVQQRSARFVSCIAVTFPDGGVLTSRGECEGTIANEPRPGGGFGYDPVFMLPDGRMMSQLSAEEKNRLSHRGAALREIKVKLMEYIKNADK